MRVGTLLLLFTLTHAQPDGEPRGPNGQRLMNNVWSDDRLDTQTWLNYELLGQIGPGVVAVNPLAEAIRAGAEVNCRDRGKYRRCIWRQRAATASSPRTSSIQSANVELVNKDGWTPLMAASKNGYPDVVERLLRAGATIDIHSYEGQTATTLAHTELQRASPGGARRRAEVVELLAHPQGRFSSGQPAARNMGDGGARLREQLQVGEHRRLEEMPEEEFQRHRRLQEADAKAREAGGGRMPRLRLATARWRATRLAATEPMARGRPIRSSETTRHAWRQHQGRMRCRLGAESADEYGAALDHASARSGICATRNHHAPTRAARRQRRRHTLIFTENAINGSKAGMV